MDFDADDIVDLVREAIVIGGDRTSDSANRASHMVRQGWAKGKIDIEEGQMLIETAPALLHCCGWKPATLVRSLPMSFEEFAGRVREGSSKIKAMREAVPPTFSEYWEKSVQPKLDAAVSRIAGAF